MGELFVYSFFFGVLFFLFPVFLCTDVYLDVKENKLWFSVGLYRRLRIFGGYAQASREGIAVHLTKKKAVFLPYDNMTDTRKKFEITQGFQLWRFHQIIETGGADQISGVVIGALIQSTSAAVFSALQTKYPFLSLKNGVLLTKTPCLKVSFQAVTVLNGLVLTIAISKKILEAIINWIRTKKSTVSWKKRQKNLQGS